VAHTTVFPSVSCPQGAESTAHATIWSAPAAASRQLALSFDGYCSTVQGLLDWVEVDLGFTELSFIQID